MTVPALPECSISGTGWHLLLSHTSQPPSTHSFLLKGGIRTRSRGSGHGSYRLGLWSQMAWAHPLAPQLLATLAWAGLFTSLTLSFLSCGMRKACEEGRLIGEQGAGCQACTSFCYPTAVTPGRPPWTHFTDEDSKAQGVKYVDSDHHGARARLRGDSRPGS